jgi:hypothetical protein
MKSRLMAAIAATVLVASSATQAAEVTGRIRSINQFANTATLDNGDSFSLGNVIDAANFHVGQLVKITYRGIGSSKRAVAMQPLN